MFSVVCAISFFESGQIVEVGIVEAKRQLLFSLSELTMNKVV